jgi:hypothetical protein
MIWLLAVAVGMIAGLAWTARKRARERGAYPPAGSGWCVNCSLNNGETWVTENGLDALMVHVEWHRATIADTGVQVKYTQAVKHDPR